MSANANVIIGTRKRKPSKRVTENGDPFLKKKKTLSSSVSTATQSISAPVSPPCAQSRTPEDANGSSNDPATQESEPEPIEVSDDSDESSVEVIEDDDAELGKCCVRF